MHPLQILRRPVITEKSTDLQDQGRYVFEVAPSATKHDIKRAVELAFQVKVVKVNTMNVHGKRRRVGTRPTKAPDWKKVIVTLAEGDTIQIFEGV